MPPPAERVHWAELTPAAFRRRRQARAVAYLPLGLCEPHGPDTPLGLDLIKADCLCAATAAAHGGIVAPAQGFHIHECGPSARWLHDEIGDVEAYLSSVGPTALSHFLLHQLRAMANAGFAAALVVSGHAGAHVTDLARIATAFTERFAFPCRYVTDFELARPEYTPDHAGRYEQSLLWHLRPDLFDDPPGTRAESVTGPDRFALGADAARADRAWGGKIFHHLVARLGALAYEWGAPSAGVPRRITFADTDALWRDLLLTSADWACARPRVGQIPVPASSRWKSEEYLYPSPIKSALRSKRPS